MNQEEKVLMLVREGNPIPDLDTLDFDTAENAVYLATLEQRSSEVTQLDTKKAEQDKQRRPIGMWLVAAAAVVIMGVAIVLVTRSSEEAPVVTEPTPTTMADAAPSTVESTPTTETPPTTLDPAEAAWQEIPPMIGRATGGEFRTVSFFVPFSFEAGDVQWVTGQDHGPDSFNINVDGMVVFVDVVPGLESVESTVQAFADWQAGYPDTSEMTDPSPTSLNGAEGVVFETFGLPFEDPEIPAPFVDNSGISFGAGEFSEVWVVDVNGDVLLVMHTFARTFPGFAVPAYSQEEYDTANAAAKALIASITWKDIVGDPN